MSARWSRPTREWLHRVVSRPSPRRIGVTGFAPLEGRCILRYRLSRVPSKETNLGESRLKRLTGAQASTIADEAIE